MFTSLDFRNKTSLQTKLVLTFFPLLLLILGCFLVYVNWFVVHPLKEKTVDEALQTATNLSELLDDYINVQNQLSQRILSNKHVFDTLTTNNQLAAYNLERIRELKDMMFQALGPSIDIRDMVIYDPDGKQAASYIGNNTPASLKPVIQDSRYSSKLANSSYILYTQQPDAFAFIRAITDQNGVIYGYLYILLDHSYLQKVADGVVGSRVYVTDSDGKTIVKSTGANPIQQVQPIAPGMTARGINTDSSRNYIAYQQSADNGWTTIIVTSKASVLGDVNSVKYFSMILIVSLTVFSLLYVYFSAKNFVLPIRRLRSQMMRMNYGNLNVKADRRLHNNELQLLNEAFGEMLERLQASIDREKQAVHEEVMARNSALQAHIAPHFIHNALYLISIASQEGKRETVSKMCGQLSESLRYIVSSPYKHVSLLEEMEHTKRYLSLVQQNYEDDLVWDIQIDPAACPILLPRLVIQPFVENCVEHAFERTDPPWKIDIKAKLYNGLWAIEISDNGSGIDPSKTDEIMSTLERSDHGAHELKRESLGLGNMGMVNTVSRLKLMYKNRLFFNIFNNEKGGTTVQIIASMHQNFY
ncbi:sensor histidine kinase [Paenibacillus sp. XY044]|uniref:sensor histidine kinase n=1 Tax=Paenibacillus sp. XY044 TaxID=2026089 RepID=UPI000B9902CB|nr:sensor histidine kinase [Paenibacillus sp. XY044]OZB98731.1 hypothetical protein CJP46_06225 [Paenibacillus sp. XY044]